MQLIINKRGSSLWIRNGRYCVRTTERETLIPVQEVKTIHLHSATKLTYEVIQTALQQNTDVLFIDRQGTPIGRIWGTKFGSISTIRKNQLSFSSSLEGVEWIRNILVTKGENQLLVLEMLQILTSSEPASGNERIEQYVKKMEAYRVEAFFETFASFRGIEGSMSRAYFEGLRALLPEVYKFEKRTKRPAMDMFNCLLNYAYGMLYGICESALIHAGVDPAIGTCTVTNTTDPFWFMTSSNNTGIGLTTRSVIYVYRRWCLRSFLIYKMSSIGLIPMASGF